MGYSVLRNLPLGPLKTLITHVIAILIIIQLTP